MIVESVGRKRRDLHILINQISQDILVFWILGASPKLNQVRAKGFSRKPPFNPLLAKVEWKNPDLSGILFYFNFLRRVTAALS